MFCAKQMCVSRVCVCVSHVVLADVCLVYCLRDRVFGLCVFVLCAFVCVCVLRGLIVC